MESGRMPACDLDSLGGETIASVRETVPTGADANNYYPSKQVRTGNRCNHDPLNLKQYIPPQNYKRRPHVIEEAIRRLKEVEDRPNKYGDVTSLFFHPADKGGRKKRSEKLEASKRMVLAALLSTLNLQKMAVGYYDNRNEFHHFDYSKLLKLTGLSLSRLKRSMKDLQDQKLVKVNTKREMTDDGGWRTTDVEIEFTDKIFEMLDLIPEFLKDRETISIKFHEKQERLDRNRKKKYLYRKPSFRSRKPEVDNKSPQSLQRLTRKLTNPYTKATQGRGYDIKTRYAYYIGGGFTPEQAAALVAKEFKPPH